MQRDRGASRSGSFRIIVEPGSYSIQNMGDVAMLQVATRRLHELWPDASIQVFNNAPAELARHCPDASPLNANGRALWFSHDYVPSPIRRLLPARLSRRLGDAEKELRYRRPATAERLMRLRLRLLRHGRSAEDFEAFIDAMHNAQLLVVCGQGSMGDATAGHAFNVLSTIEMAQLCGVPVLMFGQGIGPMRDPVLMARARQVLPYVSMIALREGRAGPPLLRSLGLPAGKVVVTGDDAIELAAFERPATLGTGLGVNVRVAGNAGTEGGYLDRIGPVLHDFADRVGAPMIPAPIARGRAHDGDLLRELLGERGDPSDGGVGLDTPAAVVRQVGRCRVLVTGAYHAAVFALAQGVSTVCLAHSDYYVDKFRGLAELFGPGCQVVEAGADLGASFATVLLIALTTAWTNADELRPELLAAADRQIEAGRAAYRTGASLVTGGGGSFPPVVGGSEVRLAG
jgi:colanic acid/amylovoran biosynthesis protein